MNLRFFRQLKPIKAISFDLDDTLYYNAPVMLITDAKMEAYFTELLPAQHAPYDYHFWFVFRQQVLKAAPMLVHDVGALREQSYFLGAKFLGMDEKQAKQFASQALAYFVKIRSDFSVPKAVHDLLTKLAEKWPLLAISNGNVDTKAIGLDKYFSAILHAGPDGKQKPDPEMFAKACQQLNIAPHELLHVGDCGANDIIGAIRFGCQSAWVSTYDVGRPISVLPTVELDEVTALARLL